MLDQTDALGRTVLEERSEYGYSVGKPQVSSILIAETDMFNISFRSLLLEKFFEAPL